MDYRVHVPRIAYRGSDKRKLERQRRDAALCAEIEIALQRRYDEIEPGTMRAILAQDIAGEIEANYEKVRQIMCRIHGGSNGVTFARAPLPGGAWAHDRAVIQTVQGDEMPSQDTTPDGRIRPHGRALHATFGEGVVTHIHFEQVTIELNEAGTKKVVDNFLTPLPL